MVDKYDPEIVGKAVQQWHCSDAIKIMLVAAIKLIEETSKFKVSGEQIIGAQGIMRTYFEALLNEVEVARTIIRLPELEKARDKIMELAGRVQLQEYSEAYKCIGEALSHITVCAERAAKVLEEQGLW